MIASLGQLDTQPTYETSTTFDASQASNQFQVSGGTIFLFLVAGTAVWYAMNQKAPRHSRKKWASGAYRDEDYEEPSQDYGVRPSYKSRQKKG